MKNGSNYNVTTLKKQVKEILKEAKNNNLIKSHTLAFDKYPTEKEAHKGTKKYFCNK